MRVPYGKNIKLLKEPSNFIVIDPIQIGDQDPKSDNCFALVYNYHIKSKNAGEIAYKYVLGEDDFAHAVYVMDFIQFISLSKLQDALSFKKIDRIHNKPQSDIYLPNCVDIIDLGKTNTGKHNSFMSLVQNILGFLYELFYTESSSELEELAKNQG